MSSSDSEPDFSNIQKRCNYCQGYNKLAPGKAYCLKCKSRCYKECKR